MGITLSKVPEDERTKWAADHSLQYNPTERTRQRALIENVGEHLYLCSYLREDRGLVFHHYFVTDHTWLMEFNTTGVCVRQRNEEACQLPSYWEEGPYKKDREVRERMIQVCGATGDSYSFALRSSEHLARFILWGSWCSFQIHPETPLGDVFLPQMQEDEKAKVNRIPDLRRQQPPADRKVYAEVDYAGFLRHTPREYRSTPLPDYAYNVVVLGPSGCGKSRLINLLFNRTISQCAHSPHSVTRDVQVFSGVVEVGNQKGRTVNVIDTVGLCDSHIPPEMVLDLIKARLKISFANIHEVVVMCSDRIQGPHVESIQQMLTWLRYTKYPLNFTFIYNKAEMRSQEDRASFIRAMRELLGLKQQSLKVEWKDRCRLPSCSFSANDTLNPSPDQNLTISKCFATGFPEGVPFSSVRGDLCKVLDSVFWPIEKGKIPVEESWCSIL